VSAAQALRTRQEPYPSVAQGQGVAGLELASEKVVRLHPVGSFCGPVYQHHREGRGYIVPYGYPDGPRHLFLGEAT